ncbi:hypothetical protein J6590_014273 [Homalodisca vitripennis]|nr:hypothetical protein J6590_014273 [Homalodisca vitripennis]
MSGTSSTYLLTPGILMRQDNCFDSTTGGTTPAKLSWRLSKHVGHIIYLFTYTRYLDATRQLLRQYNRRYYTGQTELETQQTCRAHHLLIYLHQSATRQLLRQYNRRYYTGQTELMTQ